MKLKLVALQITGLDVMVPNLTTDLATAYFFPTDLEINCLVPAHNGLLPCSFLDLTALFFPNEKALPLRGLWVLVDPSVLFGDFLGPFWETIPQFSGWGENIPCPSFPVRDNSANCNAMQAFLAHLAAKAWAGHFEAAMAGHSMAAIACPVAALATLTDSNAALAESDPFEVALTGSFLSFVDIAIVFCVQNLPIPERKRENYLVEREGFCPFGPLLPFSSVLRLLASL